MGDEDGLCLDDDGSREVEATGDGFAWNVAAVDEVGGGLVRADFLPADRTTASSTLLTRVISSSSSSSPSIPCLRWVYSSSSPLLSESCAAPRGMEMSSSLPT